jgi:hypothetical protein
MEGFAIVKSSVYITQDGGVSWSAYSISQIAANSVELGVFSAADRNYWVLGGILPWFVQLTEVSLLRISLRGILILTPQCILPIPLTVVLAVWVQVLQQSGTPETVVKPGSWLPLIQVSGLFMI